MDGKFQTCSNCINLKFEFCSTHLYTCFIFFRMQCHIWHNGFVYSIVANESKINAFKAIAQFNGKVPHVIIIWHVEGVLNALFCNQIYFLLTEMHLSALSALYIEPISTFFSKKKCSNSEENCIFITSLQIERSNVFID